MMSTKMKKITRIKKMMKEKKMRMKIKMKTKMRRIKTTMTMTMTMRRRRIVDLSLLQLEYLVFALEKMGRKKQQFFFNSFELYVLFQHVSNSF